MESSLHFFGITGTEAFGSISMRVNFIWLARSQQDHLTGPTNFVVKVNFCSVSYKLLIDLLQMSLLKQIDDKGAVLEWSPVAQHANLVALGTKVGFCPHTNYSRFVTLIDIL